MPAVQVPSPPSEEAQFRYLEDPRAAVPGNQVRLLRNGDEAFPVWLAAIDGARDRVSLEMYIFADDEIGRRFGDALSRAARRGVVVRLLYDYIGCRDTSPDFFAGLRAAGVHTIAYHRYRFWRPRFWALFRRNHRKTLVCDGQVAFTGGLNISDAWVGAAAGGGDWHDAAVEVRGPAVPRLEGAFLATWNRRAKQSFRLQPAQLAAPARVGDARVVVVSNTERHERFAIRRTALHALREARRRIFLANPYFVPDRGILRALRGAAERGVDVRILVPVESDSLTLDYAARATFSRLLASGVRIFEHPRVVHTKALLVDEAFTSIGSYNLDRRSLSYNLEMVVNTLDTALADATASMFDDEFRAARETSAELFAARSLYQRVFERLAWGLRHWL